MRTLQNVIHVRRKEAGSCEAMKVEQETCEKGKKTFITEIAATSCDNKEGPWRLRHNEAVVA